MRAQNRVMYWYITLFNSMHRYITCLHRYMALFNSVHRYITCLYQYKALFNSMHRYITCLHRYKALFNSVHRHITRVHRYMALFCLARIDTKFVCIDTWKILPCTPGGNLTISPQPFIRFSRSWTFWKWERKIYNFHVQQNSIWSFFDGGKLGWSRSKNLPSFWKLETIGHFSFWKPLLWPQILQCEYLKCQMRLVWTWMEYLLPSPSSKSINPGTVDFSDW